MGYTVRLDDVLQHSIKDYHVKGFDYICLHRARARTVKLYFFDGDVSKMPEVVNPHDHRYDFTTECLAGGVANHVFTRAVRGGTVYQEFEYATPLNGGSGFAWKDERRLQRVCTQFYERDQGYHSDWRAIHTIQLTANETVLRLVQFEDVVPIGVPTTMFSLGKESPSLSGLYSKFTADEAIARLRNFSERTGIRIEFSDCLTERMAA